MTVADMLAVDSAVRDALHVSPLETIEAASRRIMSAPHGNPVWRVARAILADDADVWRRMRRAAKAARRLETRTSA